MSNTLDTYTQITRGLVVSKRPLQTLCQRIVDVLQVKSVQIYLLDSGSQTLHLFAQAGNVIELIGQIDTSHVPNANTDSEIVEVEIIDIIDDPLGKLTITFPTPERAHEADYHLLQALSQFAGEVALAELSAEQEAMTAQTQTSIKAVAPPLSLDEPPEVAVPQILYTLMHGLSRQPSTDALADFITTTISDSFDVNYFSLALIESGSSQIELTTLVGGRGRSKLPLQGSVFQQAVAEDRTIKLAREDRINQDIDWMPPTDGPVYILPLGGRAELLGTLNVGVASELSSGVGILEQAGRLVALSLENFRLMDRLEQSIGEANLIYNFNLSANTAANLQEVYRLTLEELAATSQANAVRLFIAGPDPRTALSYVEEVGQWKAETLQSFANVTRYDLGKAPIISQFAQSRSNVLFNNLEQAEQIDHDIRNEFADRGVTALMLVPLSTGAVWLGAALLEGDRPFTAEQSQITRSVADQAAIAIDTQMLITRTRASVTREQTLREVTVRIRNSETIEEVMQIAAEHMSGILDMSPESVEYMSAHTSQRHQLDPEQRELIETVSSQVSFAVENLNLLESTQKTAFREQIVNDVTARIQRSTTTDKVLEETVKALQEVFDGYDISLQLTQETATSAEGELS